MNFKKASAVILLLAFGLTLTLTNTYAYNAKPKIVHPLTGQAPVNTFVVTKTTDSGDNNHPGTGTLRRAILDANASPGFDLIVFDIPGNGTKTITPPLPMTWLLDEAGVMIDGTTSDDRVEIDASQTSGNFTFYITGDNNVIKGLTFTNNPNAAAMGFYGSHNNVIIGNYIGTNTAGTAAKPNFAGILFNGSNNNQIGGTDGVSPDGACTGDCNLISGNVLHGVLLDNHSRNNRIIGNFIGVNKNGSAGIPNKDEGVMIANSPNNIVGGPTPQERNVISANSVGGVELALEDSRNNLVQGNYIGTNSAGNAVIGGGTGVFGHAYAHDNVIDGNLISGMQKFGVLVFNDAHSFEIKNNRIGLAATSDANLGNGQKGIELQSNNTYIHHNRVANNGSDGVRVKKGNNNRISQNEIFNNRTFGINLGTDAFSPNDNGDGDGGPNGLQNFPTLNSAEHDGTTLTIKGNLNSRPNARFTLEFFQNPACDNAFGNAVGEGKVYLGSIEVTTNGGGNASFTAPLSNAPSTGVVTATATDSQDNTSEFSYCRGIVIVTPPDGEPTKPELLSPQNDQSIVENPPTLDWSPSENTNSYKVVIRDGSPKGPKVHVGRTTNDSYVPPFLESGKTYYWRVFACNALKCVKSAMFNFHIP